MCFGLEDFGRFLEGMFTLRGLALISAGFRLKG